MPFWLHLEFPAHLTKLWERQRIQPVATQYVQVVANEEQLWEFDGFFGVRNLYGERTLHARQTWQIKLVPSRYEQVPGRVLISRQMDPHTTKVGCHV